MLAFYIPKPWAGTISRTQGCQNPMLLELKAARIIQAGLSMFQVPFQYSEGAETPVA
jgi:hypothetical protein